MTSAQQRTLEWLANGETGTSSKTMAMWLAFDVQQRYGSHPLDPADFDRCLRLLAQVPEMRAQLYRMGLVSPVWAALIERWDEIEVCHLDEVGLGWTKAKMAKRTYDLMRSIIEPVEQTATS
jgi:hypothetical protein